MTTLTIQVEDRSVLAGLKKVLNAMNGVVILPARKEKKTGLEEAMDDIRNGRITEYSNSDEMFKDLGL